MRADWQSLRDELQRWRDDGLAATFWWRDDDACDTTPQLERLLATATDLGVTPALAVIPAGATPALAQRLHDAPWVDVLQHGYAHLNHAPAGDKKTELGAHRDLPAITRELLAGRERLSTLAIPCLPVLVPPWNRMDERLLSPLAEHGYVGVSTFAARAAGTDPPGMIRVNTHVDPIAWQGDRGFRGEDAVLQQVLEHLQARRAGLADRTEATGLLTHHLVQDEACWKFCERLVAETRSFSNVGWSVARRLFDPALH